jgi:hypothetical protein
MRAYQLTQGTGIDAISRRDFGVVAGAAGLSLMAPGQSLAANELNGALVNYSRGLIESPPTYYEVLQPVGGAKKPPMVLFPAVPTLAPATSRPLMDVPAGRTPSSGPATRSCYRIGPASAVAAISRLTS